MLLAEPQRTNYDLHFRIFGISVRVHPLFWLVALFTGAAPDTTPKQTLLWMGALFVSILVHELGHAVAILWYGYRPWITLHALGGLASFDRGYAASYGATAGSGTTTSAQIVIALAGPAAGFIFAAIVVGVLLASGGGVSFALGGPYLFDWRLSNVASDNLYYLLDFVIFINLFWGLVNLLPIYPLDGGQVARELLLVANPSRGLEWSLQLSMASGIAMGLYALVRFQSPFLAVFLFGYLAFASYQALVAYRGFSEGWTRTRYGDDDDSDRGRGW